MSTFVSASASTLLTSVGWIFLFFFFIIHRNPADVLIRFAVEAFFLVLIFIGFPKLLSAALNVVLGVELQRRPAQAH